MPDKEEEFDDIISQEQQEDAAWSARGWDFDEPEVDPAAQRELDDLWSSLNKTSTDKPRAKEAIG